MSNRWLSQRTRLLGKKQECKDKLKDNRSTVARMVECGGSDRSALIHSLKSIARQAAKAGHPFVEREVHLAAPTNPVDIPPPDLWPSTVREGRVREARAPLLRHLRRPE